jgi:hypothetical protein
MQSSVTWAVVRPSVFFSPKARHKTQMPAKTGSPPHHAAGVSSPRLLREPPPRISSAAESSVDGGQCSAFNQDEHASRFFDEYAPPARLANSNNPRTPASRGSVFSHRTINLRVKARREGLDGVLIRSHRNARASTQQRSDRCVGALKCHRPSAGKGIPKLRIDIEHPHRLVCRRNIYSCGGIKMRRNRQERPVAPRLGRPRAGEGDGGRLP